MMNYNESNFVQEILLPSKGLLNPEIPEGKVTQRCMMVADQKTMAGSNQSSGNALHSLLQKTITAPEGFDISNLTVDDTLYLMFKLRILSYGEKYSFKTRCPECGRKITVNIDLSELPVDTLEEGYEDKTVVTLPHRGDTVYTRIMTNRDQEELNKEIKRRKKKNPNDESAYVLRIVYSISKIKIASDKSELTHPIDIERYVNSLTDYDARAILHTRDSLSFGIAPTIDYVCPECNETIEVPLAFSSDFFRPNAFN